MDSINDFTPGSKARVLKTFKAVRTACPKVGTIGTIQRVEKEEGWIVLEFAEAFEETEGMMWEQETIDNWEPEGNRIKFKADEIEMVEAAQPETTEPMYLLVRAYEDSPLDSDVQFAVLKFDQKAVQRWKGYMDVMVSLSNDDWSGPSTIKWDDHAAEYFIPKGETLPEIFENSIHDEYSVILAQSELKEYLPLVSGDMNRERDFPESSHCRTDINHVVIRRNSSTINFDGYVKDGPIRVYTATVDLEELEAELASHTPFTLETLKEYA